MDERHFNRLRPRFRRASRRTAIASGALLLLLTTLATGVFLPGLFRQQVVESAEPDISLYTKAMAGSQRNGQHISTDSPRVIPAAAFVADRNVESDYYMDFSGGYIRSNNATGVYCGTAPLYLPQGVTITAFTGFVYDTFSGDDVWIDLQRRAYGSTASASEIGTTTTSGEPGFQAISDTTISNPVVDNSTYVYYVTTCFGRNTTGSGNRLYAVEVNFMHKVHVPLVVNN